MSNQNDPVVTAELRAKREALERLEDAQEAFVQTLRATWSDAARDAAAREGVRFVVLARIVSMSGECLPPILKQVAADAKARGFELDLVDQLSAPAESVPISGNLPSAPREAYEVSDGRERGWYPGSVQKYGSRGSIKWLVVRW